MSYAVTSKEGKYDLLEKSSDVLIELNYEEKKAKDMCRKLNLGAGFNGWTPPFFAVKYNGKEES
jgi:hypothetical protein